MYLLFDAMAGIFLSVLNENRAKYLFKTASIVVG